MSDKIVFTKHANERMSLRSVSQADVISVLRKPDRTQPTEKPETTKFIRSLRNREIQIIARHLSGENKTLVISVWVRGEDDPEPMAWTIFMLPFKLLWWIGIQLWRVLFKRS